MKLHMKGALSVFIGLCADVDKEIAEYDTPDELMVELPDFAQNGSFLRFYRKVSRPTATVEFLLLDGGRVELRVNLYLSHGHFQQERCVFSNADIGRGVRATAAFIVGRLMKYDTEPFEDYFQQTPATAESNAT